MGLTNRKVTKTVYITPEQNNALERLAKATRIPQSELIREGIELALKKYEKVIQGEDSAIVITK